MDENPTMKKLLDKIMETITNPKPLEKPPYTCPKAEYGEEKKCAYPNCMCKWTL